MTKQFNLTQMSDTGLSANTATISSLTMTTDEWIATPPHPYRRNADACLERVVKAHLAVVSPLHALACMAVLPDGRRSKLDGHTRALAWEESFSNRPSTVTAIALHVRDDDEALELYRQIDSQDAVRSFLDRAYGAGHGCNLRNVDTNRYAALARYGTPACLASTFRRGGEGRARPIDVYQAVSEHKEAIEALIDFNPNSCLFPIGVQTAFILTHEKHGVRALDFWQKFADNAGSNIGQYSDGIEALHDFIRSQPNRTRSNGHIDKNRYVCGVAIACFEAYLNGHTQRARPRMIDIGKCLATECSNANERR